MRQIVDSTLRTDTTIEGTMHRTILTGRSTRTRSTIHRLNVPMTVETRTELIGSFVIGRFLHACQGKKFFSDRSCHICWGQILDYFLISPNSTTGTSTTNRLRPTKPRDLLGWYVFYWLFNASLWSTSTADEPSRIFTRYSRTK